MTAGSELRQFGLEPYDHDAFLRLLKLLHKQTLRNGRWSEAMAASIDTPTEGGFDEIWLADYTQAGAFGAVDLFALVHAELEGHFATGDQGQKPYVDKRDTQNPWSFQSRLR